MFVGLYFCCCQTKHNKVKCFSFYLFSHLDHNQLLFHYFIILFLFSCINLYCCFILIIDLFCENEDIEANLCKILECLSILDIVD